MLPSYPKVYNVGHRAIKELLMDDVVVQEKVDGSQLSFGVLGGVLHIRSRGAEIDPWDPPAIFKPAVETVRDLYDRSRLPRGYVFRAEALHRPKHNTLAYGRAPQGGLILFDVMIGDQDYAPPTIVQQHGHFLELEVVPLFHYGRLATLDAMMALMERESVLGGAKVEGIVIKNYHRFGIDGKPLFGKYVSEAFKESNKATHVKPGRGDVIEGVVAQLRTEARWQKAVQHLREAGELLDEPKDIGPLIKALQADVEEEEGEHMRDVLYKWAKPQVMKGVSRGFAEWYKMQLAALAFHEAGVEDE